MDLKKNPPPETEKSKPNPIKSIGVIILRLLLTVILAVLLGAGVYYGALGVIPTLDLKLLQPKTESLTRINVRETQEAGESQITRLEKTLVHNQTLLANEIYSYQSTLVFMEEELQRLNTASSSAQSTLDASSSIITLYPQILSTLQANQSSNTRLLETLASAQISSNWIRQEIELLKILDLLSHANQFLLHANFGLAEETLTIAKNDLLFLREDIPSFQQEVISEMLDLVDQVIIDLPAKPALAAEKLELAWQLGITGLPQFQLGDSANPPTPTSSEAENLTLTPTPTPTPQ